MRLIILLLACAIALPAMAQERILSYHSDLRIQPDGALEVSETITVRAEGNSIRRGIYRDFPTRYRDRFGNAVKVKFEPVEVLRDGQAEPWFTEVLSNGVRLNTGNDDFLTVPAEHTYTLRYRTTRQLGYFDAHDELYWNVNGNGWEFAIERLSAEVHLPRRVEPGQLQAEAYTGYSGDNGRDYEARIEDGVAHYAATRALAPQEGLTLVLGFPKGIVPVPTAQQRLLWLLYDNRGVLICLIGLGLLLAFYYARWQRYGRDLDPGSIFPHYGPPTGESPGGLRYLQRMMYDSRCFAADLIDMAVRGVISIEREKGFLKDEWALQRNPEADTSSLSASQQAIASKLFSKSDRIELKSSNASEIGGARNQQLKALATRYQPRYFVHNGGTVAMGFLFSLAYGVPAIVIAQGDGVVAMVILLVLALIAHGVFGRLMQAPTKDGRKLLDQVEGLKLYLSVAERDELKSLQGPGAPPALDAARYEALLPFAVALDVEDAWTEKFTLAVGVTAAAAAASGMHWYHGSGAIGDLGRLSHDLGSSLSSQISSSANPPGSSSGAGGGGSSGGGGGGGGGGGR